jgi:hypothetical protein
LVGLKIVEKNDGVIVAVYELPAGKHVAFAIRSKVSQALASQIINSAEDILDDTHITDEQRLQCRQICLKYAPYTNTSNPWGYHVPSLTQEVRENNVLIQMVDNPKRRGKDSWKRYNQYQNASTLREIIELSVTASATAARAKQISKAKDDIKYDFLHGYILFPQYETNSYSHFVSAREIALMANVMNVHQL